MGIINHKEEKHRFVMHVSSVEGHHHFVSPLTNESESEILGKLFVKDEEMVVNGNTAQGDGFYVRVELLSDYIDTLPEGKEKEYYAFELARPSWTDNKVGRVVFKILCALRIVTVR